MEGHRWSREPVWWPRATRDSTDGEPEPHLGLPCLCHWYCTLQNLADFEWSCQCGFVWKWGLHTKLMMIYCNHYHHHCPIFSTWFGHFPQWLAILIVGTSFWPQFGSTVGRKFWPHRNAKSPDWWELDWGNHPLWSCLYWWMIIFVQNNTIYYRMMPYTVSLYHIHIYSIFTLYDIYIYRDR